MRWDASRVSQRTTVQFDGYLHTFFFFFFYTFFIFSRFQPTFHSTLVCLQFTFFLFHNLNYFSNNFKKLRKAKKPQTNSVWLLKTFSFSYMLQRRLTAINISLIHVQYQILQQVTKISNRLFFFSPEDDGASSFPTTARRQWTQQLSTLRPGNHLWPPGATGGV